MEDILYRERVIYDVDSLHQTCFAVPVFTHLGKRNQTSHINHTLHRDCFALGNGVYGTSLDTMVSEYDVPRPPGLSILLSEPCPTHSRWLFELVAFSMNYMLFNPPPTA